MAASNQTRPPARPSQDNSKKRLVLVLALGAPSRPSARRPPHNSKKCRVLVLASRRRRAAVFLLP
jgi:hypothetical protein